MIHIYNIYNIYTYIHTHTYNYKYTLLYIIIYTLISTGVIMIIHPGDRRHSLFREIHMDTEWDRPPRFFATSMGSEAA